MTAVSMKYKRAVNSGIWRRKKNSGRQTADPNSMRNHIRDRVARFSHGGDVIFAKEGRQCGGNLALSDSVDSSAFAESGGIRTEEGYPNIFRVRNFLDSLPRSGYQIYLESGIFWPWSFHLC